MLGELRNLTSLKVLKLPYEIVWKEAQAQYKLRYDEGREDDDEVYEEDDGAAGLEDIACLENLKMLQMPEWTDCCSDDSPIRCCSQMLSSNVSQAPSLEFKDLNG